LISAKEMHLHMVGVLIDHIIVSGWPRAAGFEFVHRRP